jgi:hypothetical protein
MATRCCKKCGECKQTSDFGPHKGYPDGLRTTCRACKAAESRVYYYANIDKSREYHRRKARYWKYGLSEEDIQTMTKAQGGKCATCGKEKRLIVDHCHTSGNIRGLLCYNCNTALGKTFDDKIILNNLIQYLEGHNTHGDAVPQI